MAHEFHPDEEGPKTQAGGSLVMGPPRKRKVIGTIDPPKSPWGPSGVIGHSGKSRAVAVVILIALALLAAVAVWKIL